MDRTVHIKSTYQRVWTVRSIYSSIYQNIWTVRSIFSSTYQKIWIVRSIYGSTFLKIVEKLTIQDFVEKSHIFKNEPRPSLGPISKSQASSWGGGQCCSKGP